MPKFLTRIVAVLLIPELFFDSTACNAIQHAAQRAILHRDNAIVSVQALMPRAGFFNLLEHVPGQRSQALGTIHQREPSHSMIRATGPTPGVSWDPALEQEVMQRCHLPEGTAASVLANGWTPERIERLQEIHELFAQKFAKSYLCPFVPELVFTAAHGRHPFSAPRRPGHSYIKVDLSAITYENAMATMNSWFLEEWAHGLQGLAMGEFAAFPEMTPDAANQFYAALKDGMSHFSYPRFALPSFDVYQFQPTDEATGSVARQLLEVHAAAIAWKLSHHRIPRGQTDNLDGRAGFWRDRLISDKLSDLYQIPELAKESAIWESVLQFDKKEKFLPASMRWHIRWLYWKYTWRAIFEQRRSNIPFFPLREAYKSYFLETVEIFGETWPWLAVASSAANTKSGYSQTASSINIPEPNDLVFRGNPADHLPPMSPSEADARASSFVSPTRTVEAEAFMALQQVHPGQRSLYIESVYTGLPVAESLMGLHVDVFRAASFTPRIPWFMGELRITEEAQAHSGELIYHPDDPLTTAPRQTYDHITAIHFQSENDNQRYRKFLEFLTVRVKPGSTILVRLSPDRFTELSEFFKARGITFHKQFVDDSWFRVHTNPYPIRLLTVKSMKAAKIEEGFPDAPPSEGNIQRVTSDELLINPWMQQLYARRGIEVAPETFQSFLKRDHPLKVRIFDEIDALSEEQILRQADEAMIHESTVQSFNFTRPTTVREIFLRPTAGAGDMWHRLVTGIMAIASNDILSHREAEFGPMVRSWYLTFRAIEILSRQTNLELIQAQDIEPDQSGSLFDYLASGVIRFDSQIQSLLNLRQLLEPCDTPQKQNSLRKLVTLLDRLAATSKDWEEDLSQIKFRDQADSLREEVRKFASPVIPAKHTITLITPGRVPDPKAMPHREDRERIGKRLIRPEAASPTASSKEGSNDPPSASSQKSVVETIKLGVRELQVLELYGRGLEINEIAKRLNISRDTVYAHLSHIARKYDPEAKEVGILDHWSYIWRHHHENRIPVPPTYLKGVGSDEWLKARRKLDTAIREFEQELTNALGEDFGIMKEGFFSVKEIAATRSRSLRTIKTQFHGLQTRLKEDRYKSLRALAIACDYNPTIQMMAILAAHPILTPPAAPAQKAKEDVLSESRSRFGGPGPRHAMTPKEAHPGLSLKPAARVSPRSELFKRIVGVLWEFDYPIEWYHLMEIVGSSVTFVYTLNIKTTSKSNRRAA